MSKYLYTPKDIAVFFDYSDFRKSDEKMVREDLWENRNIVLDSKYRKDKKKFISEISKYMVILSLKEHKKELEEINIIFEELGSEYEMNLLEREDYYVEVFFIFIKLRLTYIENCNFIKIKLRTLLRNLGYKRRSENIVNNIKRTMKALRLESYLRDHQICDINEIGIDDAVIIRLKQ